MKHMMRRGAFLLLMLAMAFALAVTASAAGAKDVKVQLNGQMLSFSDAAPVIQNGRTMIPMRAVFEALGAEISYDDGSRTITAVRDNTAVTMVIGQNTVQVREGTSSRSFTMDVAPSVDPASGRTYVPVRFAAEALGCNVGWDAEDSTVLIVDVDAVVAQAGPFTLMDRAMQVEKAPVEGNQLLEGSFHAKYVVDSPASGKTELPMSGSFTALSNQAAVEMDMKMDVDLSGMDTTGMSAEELALFKNMQFGMIADMEKGVYYLRPGTLADLIFAAALQGTNGAEGISPSGLSDIWFKLDLNAVMEQMPAMMEQMGMNLPELSSGELTNPTVGGILTEILRMVPLTDKDEDWAAIQIMMDTFSALLSDKSFVEEGGNYVCNYALTAPVNGQSMAVSYKLTLAMAGEEVTGISLIANVEQGSDKIGIEVTGDSKTAHIDMSLTAEGTSAGLKMDVTETAVSMDMNIATSGQSDITMDYHLEGVITAADKAPVTQPPADTQIIDLNMQLFGIMPAAA